MSIFEPADSPRPSRMLSILRIVAGVVFVSFGTMKLFNYPPSRMPGFPVHLNSELGLAGMLETFGGVAILLGFLTRPVAFVLGTPAILYYFLFLYLTVAGGGVWSIDATIARARRPS